MDVRDIEVFNFVMLVVFSSGIHNSSVKGYDETKKKYVGIRLFRTETKQH